MIPPLALISPIFATLAVIIIPIIILLVIFKLSRGKKDAMVCLQCGCKTTETRTNGHIGIEILLWIFFCLPGLLYSAWRIITRCKVCSQCKSDKLIPADSAGWQKANQSMSNNITGNDSANCQVSRNGAILGTHSEAQLYQLLMAGHYLPTDFYWKPGMTDWLPLSKLAPKPTLPPIPSQNQMRGGSITKGSIINFNIQTGTGIITGDNGIRYNFVSASWGSTTVLPAIGLTVEFIASGLNAHDIYPLVVKAQHGNPSSSEYYRSSDNTMISGVCAGLAHKWNSDVMLVRIAMLFIPLGWVFYIIGTGWPSKPTR